MRYQNLFRFFGLGGLTPGPKFIKRGDDLADSEIYQPTKFHRPMSTHTQDIRYHVTKVLRTKKKTVNDISTTCLLACVDNKERHSKLSILLYAMYGGIKTFTNSECLWLSVITSQHKDISLIFPQSWAVFEILVFEIHIWNTFSILYLIFEILEKVLYFDILNTFLKSRDFKNTCSNTNTCPKKQYVYNGIY